MKQRVLLGIGSLTSFFVYEVAVDGSFRMQLTDFATKERGKLPGKIGAKHGAFRAQSIEDSNMWVLRMQPNDRTPVVSSWADSGLV
nr:hypothetical protein [Sunxiuqinia sp.]